MKAIADALEKMGFGHFWGRGFGVTVFGSDGEYKAGGSDHLRYLPAHRDLTNLNDKVGSVWVHPQSTLTATGQYVVWLNDVVAANLEAATSAAAERRYPGWRDHSGGRAVTALLVAPAALGRMSE